MKNIFNKTLILSIFLINTQFSFANSVNENLNATAKIDNFCSIQAQDVNFGVLSLPLTSQSAISEMRVLCTNNTQYKIDLSYGKYIPVTSDYTIKYSSSFLSGNARHTYYIYNETGTNIGYIACGFGGIYAGKVYINNPEMATLYNYSQSAIWHMDTNKTCQSNGTASGTFPTGWVGAYNANTSQPVGGLKYSEFGFMSGTIKGDTLAYKVTVPNDSSKTWSKGLNSYNNKGTGIEQTFNINAQIVPDKSSSKYVAQDVYLDNVTAEVTY